ncbi:hypothetical protein QFZ27_006666 [Inquilinus ginsengisoli]|uniref:hypothetical protein n=1 Tax=Inquilinus ginsengisoli TaxID=363840 RepID=UPI003D210CBC
MAPQGSDPSEWEPVIAARKEAYLAVRAVLEQRRSSSDAQPLKVAELEQIVGELYQNWFRADFPRTATRIMRDTIERVKFRSANDSSLPSGA